MAVWCHVGYQWCRFEMMSFRVAWYTCDVESMWRVVLSALCFVWCGVCVMCLHVVWVRRPVNFFVVSCRAWNCPQHWFRVTCVWVTWVSCLTILDCVCFGWRDSLLWSFSYVFLAMWCLGGVVLLPYGFSVVSFSVLMPHLTLDGWIFVCWCHVSTRTNKLQLSYVLRR